MACERLQVEIDEMKEKNLLVDEDLKDLTTNHRTLERYARETFYMKRDNEDVFVIKTNY
jgi:FtsZ-binding cell division protein ZapB